MLQVVKTPTSNLLFDLVQRSEKELLFCVPFIKKEIVDVVLKKLQPDAVLGLITYSNIGRFANGSLDIEALRILLEKGFKIFNYQNLHAKIYLFDNKKVLITSANLTNNALYKNYEYGVLIDNDSKIIDQIYSDFVNMMDSVLCGEITLKTLNDIEKNIKQYQKKYYVQVDSDEDDILICSSALNLTKNLAPWQKEVFLYINQFSDNVFYLDDLYKEEKTFQQNHPTNKHIKEKIRQVLQQLRDLGYVKFVSPGIYKKLWKIS